MLSDPLDLAPYRITERDVRQLVRMVESARAHHAYSNARVERIRQARMLFEGVGG